MVQLVNYLAAMQDTWVQFLGWEDSPGEGNSYPLQYSGLENCLDCGPWGHKESTTEQLALDSQAPCTTLCVPWVMWGRIELTDLNEQ